MITAIMFGIFLIFLGVGVPTPLRSVGRRCP